MSHNNKTAKIFGEINSTREQQRVEKQYTEEYFQVNDGYFNGKDCADIGCGAKPVGAKRMLQMGANTVTCVDIDEKIEDVGKDYMGDFSEDAKFITKDANEFAQECDEKFDHIHAAGSIHHMENKEIAFETLNSLSNLTQQSFYFSLQGSGGLMSDLNDALRNKYKNDTAFKQFIDQLDVQEFEDFFDYLRKNVKYNHVDLLIYIIKNGVDDDLVLSLKDRVCAPTYLRFEESELRRFLQNKCGFNNIKRLTYKPELDNIRRAFSPLYEEYDNKYARLLYGDGFIQLWCDYK